MRCKFLPALACRTAFSFGALNNNANGDDSESSNKHAEQIFPARKFARDDDANELAPDDGRAQDREDESGFILSEDKAGDGKSAKQ